MDTEPVRGDLFAMLSSEERNSPESFSNEAVEIRNETTEGFFLIMINPASGGIETIGQTSGSDLQFAAIALLNEQTIEVPTLSEYGLILTVVMLLGAAVVFLRRRQTTSGI